MFQIEMNFFIHLYYLLRCIPWFIDVQKFQDIFVVQPEVFLHFSFLFFFYCINWTLKFFYGNWISFERSWVHVSVRPTAEYFLFINFHWGNTNTITEINKGQI